MQDDYNIAPTDVLIRYLCLFQRYFQATRGYVQNRDEQGVFLSAWIADALHNIPGMLWNYDPNRNYNSPQELADWMEIFPQVVRHYNAPSRIAAECDVIFSPEVICAELHLRDDLSDLDLAPPEKMAAYLDLFYRTCLSIRAQAANENPWTQKNKYWEARKEATTTEMGRMMAVLVEVPCALVHWKEFDEARFSALATPIWEGWPRYYGLGRLQDQRRWQRMKSRWIEPIPEVQFDHRAFKVFYWLTQQYRQPWRLYHDLAHIEQMFVAWDAVGDAVKVSDPFALTLAIWFHDAVYDPRQSDNEAKSAEAMVEQLEPYSLSEQQVTHIRQMIMATQTHQVENEDLDTALLLDLDLAILGAEASAYQKYARAIREEYHFVPEADFRAGRIQVLRRFLERPRLYLTEPMFTRLEAQARQNMTREIETLENPSENVET